MTQGLLCWQVLQRTGVVAGVGDFPGFFLYISLALSFFAALSTVYLSFKFQAAMSWDHQLERDVELINEGPRCARYVPGKPSHAAKREKGDRDEER